MYQPSPPPEKAPHNSRWRYESSTWIWTAHNHTVMFVFCRQYVVKQRVPQNMTSLRMFINRFQVLLHKLHVSFPVPVLGSGIKIATMYLTDFYCGNCFHSYGTACNNDILKWIGKHTKLIFKNCHQWGRNSTCSWQVMVPENGTVSASHTRNATSCKG